MINSLKKANFTVARIKGSHHFLIHPDGRRTVIPVHSGKTIRLNLSIKKSEIIKTSDYLFWRKLPHQFDYGYITL